MKIQFIEGFIFRQYKDIKTYGIKELLDIYKIAVKQKNNFNFPIPIFWN